MALAGFRLIRNCSRLLRRYPSVTPIAAINVNRFIPRRQFSVVDDDGDVARFRTTVSILNHEQDQGIFIDSYSSMGFLLNSGIRIVGPCAVFPRSILHWNVSGVQGINEDSLQLFTMLEPKIDILIIGVGERENIPLINPDIVRFLKMNKINVEILSTDQALATFNFLNAEKRYVAGAFIPPSYVETYNADEVVDPSGKFEPTDEGLGDDDITKIFPLTEEFKKQLKGGKDDTKK